MDYCTEPVARTPFRESGTSSTSVFSSNSPLACACVRRPWDLRTLRERQEGGALIQLGAFPSEASANAAWSALAKRFGYVATLGKVVQPATVNGRTVYRLRVNAGSANAASDICGRLKVAGEGCFVTS